MLILKIFCAFQISRCMLAGNAILWIRTKLCHIRTALVVTPEALYVQCYFFHVSHLEAILLFISCMSAFICIKNLKYAKFPVQNLCESMLLLKLHSNTLEITPRTTKSIFLQNKQSLLCRSKLTINFEHRYFFIRDTTIFNRR